MYVPVPIFSKPRTVSAKNSFSKSQGRAGVPIVLWIERSLYRNVPGVFQTAHGLNKLVRRDIPFSIVFWFGITVRGVSVMQSVIQIGYRSQLKLTQPTNKLL
jgi:hypothetical protein